MATSAASRPRESRAEERPRRRDPQESTGASSAHLNAEAEAAAALRAAQRVGSLLSAKHVRAEFLYIYIF